MADSPTDLTEERILQTLGRIVDPDLKRDIVSLGMIRDLKIEGEKVSFRFVLTTPACPVRDELQAEARQAVEKLAGEGNVQVRMESEVPRHRGGDDKQAIRGVKNILAVTSGKGGVGKTTVSVNLACALAREGARVGLLDCDVYGPNVPMMLGLSGKPMARGNQIVPLEAYGLKVMSMGFMAEGDTPLIWRGPMLHGVIQQFLRQVDWGELDYLIADMPPGTGDVQLTMMQSVPLMGGIVVTTPQDVALADARRGVMMFKQTRVDVLGIVENMSTFVCPHCRERSDIFSHGGGRKTSETFQVPFLGDIPLEIQVREGGDKGEPIVLGDASASSVEAFMALAKNVAAKVSQLNLSERPTVELEL